MSEKNNVKTKYKKAGISIAKAGDDIITFSETNVHRIQVLTCEDDKVTINGKLRDSYKMRVLDLNDIGQDGKPIEKDFNTASARLREKISEINEEEGIIGQKLRIEAIGQGTKRYYEVSKIK